MAKKSNDNRSDNDDDGDADSHVIDGNILQDYFRFLENSRHRAVRQTIRRN